MQLTVVVLFSQHNDTFDLVVKQTYIAHQSTTNLKQLEKENEVLR